MPLLGSTHRTASRAESKARMAEAERQLVIVGKHPTVLEREMVEQHGISRRQARRYIRAVRSIYKAYAGEDALTVDEMLALLLARAEAAQAGDDPDHKASIKALELYSRLRGWLDRKSTVTVDGSVQVTHALQHKVDALSTAERLALAAFQQARDLRAAGVVDAECVPEVAERSGDARVAPDSAGSTVPLAGLTDGEC